jgi:glycosyltransferase involved in cell wall biosynthesis
VKILMIHDRYLTRGGEDESTEAEIAILREHGHAVDFFEVDNQIIGQRALTIVGLETVWSEPAYKHTRERIRKNYYDIVHIQNFFPLLSPSVHYAAKAEGKPVVQSLRNYRLVCPNALFFRDDRNCEDCMGKFIPWPGILHRCYRQSVRGSATVAAMLTAHRLLRTWQRKVDVFFTLTEFARQRLIQGGLPAEKIVVKPNFIHPDPGVGTTERNYAMFVGRLVPEKGVNTMLQAWEKLNARIPLKIVGSGPLFEAKAGGEKDGSLIEWLGQQNPKTVYELLGKARFLIFPSEWYETFGRVAIEAFVKGTPVIASDIGAISQVTQDHVTGLLFHPGDPGDLAEKVNWAWEHPEELAEMGQNARREYEEKYTAEKNYAMLISIYEQAIASNRRQKG